MNTAKIMKNAYMPVVYVQLFSMPLLAIYPYYISTNLFNTYTTLRPAVKDFLDIDTSKGYYRRMVTAYTKGPIDERTS